MKWQNYVCINPKITIIGIGTINIEMSKYNYNVGIFVALNATQHNIEEEKKNCAAMNATFKIMKYKFKKKINAELLILFSFRISSPSYPSTSSAEPEKLGILYVLP